MAFWPFVPKAQTQRRMVLAIFSEVKRPDSVTRFTTRYSGEKSGTRPGFGPSFEGRDKNTAGVAGLRCERVLLRHPRSQATMGLKT